MEWKSFQKVRDLASQSTMITQPQLSLKKLNYTNMLPPVIDQNESIELMKVSLGNHNRGFSAASNGA